MKTEKLLITVFADDCPGILQTLSDTVLEHGGNWHESSLSRLCGQFAGIINIQIAVDKKAALRTALAELASDGIQVVVQTHSGEASESVDTESVEVVVEADDRPGIVEEIASALADAEVNIEQMETSSESAAMAGYQLFTAHLLVALPEDFDTEQLEVVLENVSDDLMVTIIPVE